MMRESFDFLCHSGVSFFNGNFPCLCPRLPCLALPHCPPRLPPFRADIPQICSETSGSVSGSPICQPCLYVPSIFFLLRCWGWRWGPRPDVGVMSGGGAIINFRSCRETKGPKWKGLAGWGDLTMSCTSVIFLVRLELSQGFNWNPDFKETLNPSTPPSPQTNSTPALTLLAGSTHVHRPYTQSVTVTISERASPCPALAGIDFTHICRYLGAWGDFVWVWVSIKRLVRPDLLD